VATDLNNLALLYDDQGPILWVTLLDGEETGTLILKLTIINLMI